MVFNATYQLCFIFFKNFKKFLIFFSGFSELHLFFPRFKPPPQEDFKPHELEKTLILVRPDAYKKFGQKKILNHLSKEGFEILMQKEYKMTMDQAEKFYFEKRNEIFYNDLIINMTKSVL